MILFSDFDGTLYRPSREGDFERNLAAIKEWRALGNKFVLTTGRNPLGLRDVFSDCWDYLDYLICDNGAIGLRGEQLDFQITIPEAGQKEITEFAKKLPSGERFEFAYDRDFRGHEDIDGNTTKIRIWAVNFEIMEAALDKLRERFDGDYLILGVHNVRPVSKFIRGEHNAAINIMSKSAGKEKALARVAREFNDEISVIGDGGNDQAMLKRYDGYIMSSARDELKQSYRESRVVDSVADLIKRLLVFEDIKKQIGVDLSRAELEFYDDGASDATVFSANKKYLVKLTDERTIRTQSTFLRSAGEAFQKLLCANEDLGYICFEYIDGAHYKDVALDSDEAIRQLREMTDGYAKYDGDNYGFLGDEKLTWFDFLEDEINYAERRIPEISRDKVNAALTIAGAREPEKRLMHGDFGAHNFLVSDGRIRVIDPMPVIGDAHYDFYFAVLSNVSLFKDGEIVRKLNLTDDYERALFIIALYVRTSRAAVYDAKHFDAYAELYAKIDI